MDGAGDLMLPGEAGPITCAGWIRRKADKTTPILVAVGRRAGSGGFPPVIELYLFDFKANSLSTAPLVRFPLEGRENTPRRIAVHPSGDEFVCATMNDCKLFKLVHDETGVRLLHREEEVRAFLSVGTQNCLAFSTDGAKFAMGGENGHLRIFHWPSVKVLLDEPRAHKSFRDMDISLDSEFLVSTSTDGSARVWKLDEGAPLLNLTRASDEKFECCAFSRDGMKPFLFCTVERRGKYITAVWDMSNWQRLGIKNLLGKSVSTLSSSLDGRYLAIGSDDGDFCIVEVKKMEVVHWSRKVHLGTPITSLEICPTERIVISTSERFDAVITKLSLPGDWKEWQIFLLIFVLFVVSAVLFYKWNQNAEHFWRFPMGKDQPARPWEYIKNNPHLFQNADPESEMFDE